MDSELNVHLPHVLAPLNDSENEGRTEGGVREGGPQKTKDRFIGDAGRKQGGGGHLRN